MPRLQVYLPDDLHAEVKARGLPASELLQAALRAEIRRLDLLAATDAYLAELGDAGSGGAGTGAGTGVGSPGAASAADRERADIIARRVSRARFGG